MPPRQSRFGSPAPMPSGSAQTEIAFEPRGLNWAQPLSDLEPGQAYEATNIIYRDGGLEHRPAIKSYPGLSTATPLGSGNVILGGAEIVTVTGAPQLLVSGTTTWAWYSTGSWSRLSYVTAGGVSDPPSVSTLSNWDIAQVYDPNSDEMLAVGANASRQSLYCWKSGSTLFSTLTSAPRAKYIASYDNYLMAFNVRDPASANSIYVQRVQWSDRGNPSNWTTGLSGFEDLLDMRGEGTRIVADGRRIVIFSDEEIWQGVSANAPFQFVFSAVDRTVGCPYPWTVTQTPLGIMFLGRGNQPYLLPKDGGSAQPFGQKIVPFLRDQQISTPERAWALYDPYTRIWRLYYVQAGSTSYPVLSVWYGIDTDEWTWNRYDTYNNAAGGKFELATGWVARDSSTNTGTLWSDSSFSGAYTWATVPHTWQQLAAVTGYGPKVAWVASSQGSVLREYPDLDFCPDEFIYNPYASWRGVFVSPQNADVLKTVNEVALTYKRTGAGNTTMEVQASTIAGVGSASGQNVTLGSSSGEQYRQASAYPYTTARFPGIYLLTSQWNARIKRILVRYRLGGLSQAE